MDSLVKWLVKVRCYDGSVSIVDNAGFESHAKAIAKAWNNQ